MCFGSGVPAYKKKDYGPLPSLGTDTSSGEGEPSIKPAMNDLVVRQGKTRRSMLMPYGKS
tara:strand:- start:19026 stop:19205 length:180 start_codon:yes stop_codon:yes gene_type:complete